MFHALFSYIMLHILPLCINCFDVDIACMIKGLINKSHCQVNPSSTNEGQPKGRVVLGA
jgi:hypothetical protein